MPRLLPGGTQLKAIEDASNRTQRLDVGRRGCISGPHWSCRKGLVYTIYIYILCIIMYIIHIIQFGSCQNTATVNHDGE